MIRHVDGKHTSIYALNRRWLVKPRLLRVLVLDNRLILHPAAGVMQKRQKRVELQICSSVFLKQLRTAMKTIQGLSGALNQSHVVKGDLDLYNNQEVSDVSRTENTDVTLQEDKIILEEVSPKVGHYLNSYTGDTRVLERQYQIKQHVVVDNTPWVTIDGYTDLFNELAVQGLLNRFRFFRGGIKFTLVMDTTPSRYGFIALAPVYSITPEFVYETFDMYNAPDLVLMDVSSRDSVEITIPYKLPTDWIDMSGALTPSMFPRLLIFNSSIRSLVATEVGTAQMSVYASFTDVEVAGPIMYAQSFASFTSAAAAGASIMGSAERAFKSAANMWEAYQDVSPSIEEIPMDMNGNGETIRFATIGELAASEYRESPAFLGTSSVPSYSGISTGPAKEEFSWNRLMHLQNYYGIHTFANQGDVWIGDDNKLSTLGGWQNIVINAHRYYRGSTNLSFHVFMSPLSSARLKLTISWGLNSGDVGDVYTDIITVQGSSVHAYNVPFICNKHWIHTRNNQYTFNYRLELISPVTSVTGSLVPFEVITFQSAGDDFVVRGYQSPAYPNVVDPPPEGDMIAQMDVSEFHANTQNFKMVGREPVKMDAMETNGIYDIINRYSSRNVRQWDLKGMGTVPPLKKHDSYDYWVSFACRYIRGNLRVKSPMKIADAIEHGYAKVILQPSNVNVSNGHWYHTGDGMCAQDTNVWPIIDFEVPFYAELDWVCSSNLFTEYNDYIPTLADTNGDVDFDYNSSSYVAAGKGFEMTILMPPVPLSVRLKQVEDHD